MKRVLVFSIIMFGLFCQKQGFSQSISVIRENRDIKIDGLIEDDEWASISGIVGFNSPWTSSNNDQTIFKCFRTGELFYFCFDVTDDDVVTYEFENELTVAKEDRVELFFSASADLNKYYCAEIDPKGRVLDYKARYYRKFDDSWNFSALKVATQITERGYTVEGSIPLSELKQLNLKKSFCLGVFRAEFNSKNDVTWFSWIKPKSEKPDFHIPSALGKCNLK